MFILSFYIISVSAIHTGNDIMSTFDIKAEDNTRDAINLTTSISPQVIDLYKEQNIPINLSLLKENLISLILNGDLTIKGNHLLYKNKDTQDKYFIRNGVLYTMQYNPFTKGTKAYQAYEQCQRKYGTPNQLDNFHRYLINDKERFVTFAPSIKSKMQKQLFHLHDILINGKWRDNVLLEINNNEIMIHYIDDNQETVQDIQQITRKMLDNILYFHDELKEHLHTVQNCYIKKYSQKNVPNILCTSDNNEFIEVSNNELSGTQNTHTIMDFLNKKFSLTYVYPDKKNIIYLPENSASNIPERMHQLCGQNNHVIIRQNGDTIIALSDINGIQSVEQKKPEAKKGFFRRMFDWFKKPFSSNVPTTINKIEIDHSPLYNSAIDLPGKLSGNMYLYNEKNDPHYIYKVYRENNNLHISKTPINALKNRIILEYSQNI